MEPNEEIARLVELASGRLREDPELRELCALMRPVVRLLVEGHPASVHQVAEVAGRPPAHVARVLRSSPDAEWTATGQLSGLCFTLRTTPHRLTIEGIRLHVWCALHALMVPALLGRAACLESSCRVTGTPIRIDISATGLPTVEPASGVIAVRAFAALGPKAIVPSCVHQALFRNDEVPVQWLAEHPDHHILSVRDAARYARHLASLWR